VIFESYNRVEYDKHEMLNKSEIEAKRPYSEVHYGRALYYDKRASLLLKPEPRLTVVHHSPETQSFYTYNISFITMFKKPLAHQSNATPLKSSARRKLLAEIFSAYPALLNGLNEEKGVSEKDLGRLILPEGIRCGSFETSGGTEGVCFCFLEERSC
jgi:hypothetical protein